jgi:heme/copper-type cytochrome/quinol oxidase subunit 2
MARNIEVVVKDGNSHVSGYLFVTGIAVLVFLMTKDWITNHLIPSLVWTVPAVIFVSLLIYMLFATSKRDDNTVRSFHHHKAMMLLLRTLCIVIILFYDARTLV